MSQQIWLCKNCGCRFTYLTPPGETEPDYCSQRCFKADNPDAAEGEQ